MGYLLYLSIFPGRTSRNTQLHEHRFLLKCIKTLYLWRWQSLRITIRSGPKISFIEETNWLRHLKSSITTLLKDSFPRKAVIGSSSRSYASHMRGVWERLIHTVRSVLPTLMSNHGTQLDNECLRTLMMDSERVVNSRPLMVSNLVEPGTLEPITPNHLLTTQSKIVLQPPGNFTKSDLFCQRHWRRVQYLVNQFWTGWRKEYSNLVQSERKKWTHKLTHVWGSHVMPSRMFYPRSAVPQLSFFGC